MRNLTPNFLIILLSFLIFYTSYGQAGNSSINKNQKKEKKKAVILLSYAYMKDKMATYKLESSESVLKETPEGRGLKAFEDQFFQNQTNDALPPRIKKKVSLDSVEYFFNATRNNWHEKGLEIHTSFKDTIINAPNLAFLLQENVFPSLAQKIDTSLKTVKTLTDFTKHLKPEPVLNSSRKPNEKGGKEVDSQSSNQEMYTIIGIALVIVLLSFFLIRRNNRERAEEDNRDTVAKQHAEIQKLIKDKNWYKNELTKVKVELSRSRQDIQDLEKKLKTDGRLGSQKQEAPQPTVRIPKQSVDPNIPEPVTPNKVIATPKTIEPFYLSIPKDENLFSLETKELKPNNKSLYRFTGGETGYFCPFLETVVNLQAPLFSHDSFFQPVCEYQNTPNFSMHKSIRVIHEGKYRLEGGSVVVTEKSLIEFTS